MIPPEIKFDCDKDGSCCKSYGRHQKDLMFRYVTINHYKRVEYGMLCPDQVEHALAYGWTSIQPSLESI